MKYVSLLFVGTALLGAAATAQAAVKLDSDSELFFTADAGLQYNDNILLTQNNQKKDTVFNIAPGLLATWGQNSATSGQISFSENFLDYADNSDLNASLAKADFSAKYDDGVSKVDSAAWFHQVDQATRDVHSANALIERNLSHAEIAGENQFAPNSSIRLGFIYDDTNYRPASYTDWQWIQVPLDYYFKVEPKLDLSAGLSYKDNQLGNGVANSTEYYYHVGARGELAPKLTGEFSIGLINDKFDGLGSRNGLGLESHFTYAYSEKTSLTFGASNENGYGGDGSAYKTFGLNGGFVAEVSSDVKIGGMLSYGSFNYDNSSRQDNFYQGQLSVTYVLSHEISFTGAYAYADNSSNLAGASFTNNIFSLGASFRY